MFVWSVDNQGCAGWVRLETLAWSKRTNFDGDREFEAVANSAVVFVAGMKKNKYKVQDALPAVRGRVGPDRPVLNGSTSAKTGGQLDPCGAEPKLEPTSSDPYL